MALSFFFCSNHFLSFQTGSALPGPSQISAFTSMNPLSTFPGYAIQNPYALMMPALGSFSSHLSLSGHQRGNCFSS